ncbi:SIS domain-containing protein OS=Streptomyces alboniger OX=132473 GN=CP975_10000 PE=4 SV=1 [Streptomyces alboniger]
MAHEVLAVPDGAELDLDTVQHLVSAAAGENAVPSPARARRRFRDRLSRLADELTAPPPARW